SGHADHPPTVPAFRKLDAVAVLTARLLPAPLDGRGSHGSIIPEPIPKPVERDAVSGLVFGTASRRFRGVVLVVPETTDSGTAGRRPDSSATASNLTRATGNLPRDASSPAAGTLEPLPTLCAELDGD